MTDGSGKSIDKKKKIAERFAEQVKAAFGGGARPRAPTPLGSGPTNRHGMPQLPIGQHEVKNWPVLDLGVHPEISRQEWRLEVDGLVERPRAFGWDDFMALPQVEDTSDFHCVTTWSRMDNRWRGVRFSTIADAVGVKPQARFVLVTAHDYDPRSGDHYTTNVSLERALDPDVLLVHEWEGKPLPREHGGPVRMITPRLYAWKGAKWIAKITFLAEDHPGFWEVRGYSNTAEPWQNDRHG